jgi:hypothetical protein
VVDRIDDPIEFPNPSEATENVCPISLDPLNPAIRG